ncbi:MAG: hypothetical protein IJT75_05105 [Bacteroidaceae bacterium]|nr:hypothetical protein [Bacteroidaceae bacterium]
MATNADSVAMCKNMASWKVLCSMRNDAGKPRRTNAFWRVVCGWLGFTNAFWRVVCGWLGFTNAFWRVVCFLLIMGSIALHAQNISEIAASDPLIISGAIGTRNTYRYTTGGYTYASPMNNSVFADMNISLYGFNMPFSLYYSNDNLDFAYPQLTLSLRPQYKNWTGYLGQNSMPFSNYILNLSFMGAGVEYKAKNWHSGIFYGRLRKAINDDPTDPLARSPQYRRMAWGFKVGYGSRRNFLDLYLLKSFDAVNSLSEQWRSRVNAQDNLVVGVKGSVSPLRWLSLTANAAMSVFSNDITTDRVEAEEATRWNKVFDVRYSSLMRYAGDVSLNLMLRGLSANLSYKMVQPDYTSLGLSYFSNNYHSLGVNLSTHLFKVVSLSANFSGQADNLTNRQMYTTRGFIYALSASSRAGEQFNISGTYNGYTQVQGDGTCVCPDSTRLHRQMNSFSLAPSYFTDTEQLSHVVSLSCNFTQNLDLSPSATGETDVKTHALGAAYTLGVKDWGMNFSLSLSDQQTRGYNMRYRSDVASLTAGRSFLEEQNLHISLTGSMVYNEVRRQSKSLSMGGSLSASYLLKKAHAFSLAASFNKYGDVNLSHRRSDLGNIDFSASLNYTYTFEWRAITRRN